MTYLQMKKQNNKNKKTRGEDWSDLNSNCLLLLYTEKPICLTIANFVALARSRLFVFDSFVAVSLDQSLILL